MTASPKPEISPDFLGRILESAPTVKAVRDRLLADGQPSQSVADFEFQLAAEWDRFNKENEEAIASVRTKLLAIGGSRMSWQPNPHIDRIAREGRLMSLPTTLKKMQPNNCGENTLELWRNRTPGSRLIAVGTGYALSADDVWRPHCWILSKTKTGTSIIETTVIFRRYYGFGLEPE
jgi:hypothetical protein